MQLFTVYWWICSSHFERGTKNASFSSRHLKIEGRGGEKAKKRKEKKTAPIAISPGFENRARVQLPAIACYCVHFSRVSVDVQFSLWEGNRKSAAVLCILCRTPTDVQLPKCFSFSALKKSFMVHLIALATVAWVNWFNDIGMSARSCTGWVHGRACVRAWACSCGLEKRKKKDWKESEMREEQQRPIPFYFFYSSLNGSECAPVFEFSIGAD